MGVYNKGHRARQLGDHMYSAEEVASIELDETPDNRAVRPDPTTRKQTMGIVVHASHDGEEGVLVSLVRHGYPGEAAGIREGDLITNVDGVPVTALADFRTTTFAAGSTVVFTVKRGSETKTFTAYKGAGDSSATGAGEGAGAGEAAADFTVADGSYSFSAAPAKRAASSERYSYEHSAATTATTASRRHY